MAEEAEFVDPTLVGEEDDDADPVINARAADAAIPDPAAQAANAIPQAANVAAGIPAQAPAQPRPANLAGVNQAPNNPGAGPLPPPVQQVANMPRNFALTPGLHDIGTAIDYGTRSGIILYQRGASALTPPFNGEPDGVTLLTERLFDRSSEMGWNHPNADILTIHTLRNGHPVQLDLIQEFGLLTMDEVLAEVMTYIGTHTRRAQNAVMMYHCIMATLTEDAHSRIVTESHRYTINGVPNGPLLFRYLLHTITIDTRATTTYIRLNMSNLDTYISVVDNDIEKFNLYVKEQRRQLKNRGEESQDLLINVFKAYLSVNDKYFVDYINRKKENYEEGGNITVDSILSDALNKFQSLKNEGLWQSKVEKDDKIVALTTQFQQMKDTLLKDKNLRLSDNVKSKSKGGKKQNKPKSKAAKKKQRDQVEAWKKVAPKTGEPQTKVHSNGKTYYWCEDHMMWCIHKPADCEERKKRVAAQEAKNKANKNNALAASFASILASDE